MVKTEFLGDILNILQKGLSADETFDAVFDILEKTVPFDSATLFLYNQVEDKLEVIHQLGDDPVDLAGEISFARGNGLSSWVSKQKKPVILQSLIRSRPGKENRFNSFISMPLWVGEKLIGVLNLGHQEPEIYKRDETKDYEMISLRISMVMEKFLLRRQLIEQNNLLQKALDELKNAQEKLIEKERLAAIGEIIITVNHEINNPLTSIIGLAEVIELTFHTGNSEKIMECLTSIQREAKRIQKVTHKLTEISSSETNEYFGSEKMIKLPA